jgi:hypothetical protein
LSRQLALEANIPEEAVHWPALAKLPHASESILFITRVCIESFYFQTFYLVHTGRATESIGTNLSLRKSAIQWAEALLTA